MNWFLAALRRWWRLSQTAMYLRHRWGLIKRVLGLVNERDDMSQIVIDFLAGASIREVAYRHWEQGVTLELCTAPNWPAAVKQTEAEIRAYLTFAVSQLEEEAAQYAPIGQDEDDIEGGDFDGY